MLMPRTLESGRFDLNVCTDLGATFDYEGENRKWKSLGIDAEWRIITTVGTSF